MWRDDLNIVFLSFNYLLKTKEKQAGSLRERPKTASVHAWKLKYWIFPAVSPCRDSLAALNMFGVALNQSLKLIVSFYSARHGQFVHFHPLFWLCGSKTSNEEAFFQYLDILRHQFQSENKSKKLSSRCSLGACQPVVSSGSQTLARRPFDPRSLANTFFE